MQPASALLRYPVLTLGYSELPVEFWLLCGCLVFIPLIVKASASQKLNRNSKIYRLITIAVILPVAVIFLAIQYDREKEYLMQFEKLIYEQDWPEVIRLHEKSPLKTIEGQYYYNLAY